MPQPPKPPKKPDVKAVEPPAEIDKMVMAIKKAKVDGVDSRGVEAAGKELRAAAKKLADAMAAMHGAHAEEHKIVFGIIDSCKTPSAPSPTPIPYPVIAKSQGATDRARKVLAAAKSAHDQCATKLQGKLSETEKLLKKKVKGSKGNEAGTLKRLMGSSSTTVKAVKSQVNMLQVGDKATVQSLGQSRAEYAKALKQIEKEQKKK